MPDTAQKVSSCPSKDDCPVWCHIDPAWCHHTADSIPADSGIKTPHAAQVAYVTLTAARNNQDHQQVDTAEYNIWIDQPVLHDDALLPVSIGLQVSKWDVVRSQSAGTYLPLAPDEAEELAGHLLAAARLARSEGKEE
jgi:hypothetical protein